MSEQRRSRVIVPPKMVEAIKGEVTFPDDLKLIMKVLGIGPTGMARSLGITPQHVLRLLKGQHLPRQPWIYVVVKEWAKQLRELQPV